MLFTFADFHRLTQRIKQKISLMVGRAVLTAIDNSKKSQRLQLVALANEVLGDVERFQEYGLETYPDTNAEVLALFFNGNRDQGIAVCVHDRRYRPTDLAAGEVALYTKEDAGGQHRIHLKSGKEIDVIGDVVSLGKLASAKKTLSNSDLVDAINTLITALNTHVHSGGTGPGGLTGTPGTPFGSLTKANYVTTETQAS